MKALVWHGRTDVRLLMTAIPEGKIDPSFAITHSCGLEDGPDMYGVFKNKRTDASKSMHPHG